MILSRAGVAQLAERLLPKQKVEGSRPFSRSRPLNTGQGHLVLGQHQGTPGAWSSSRAKGLRRRLVLAETLWAADTLLGPSRGTLLRSLVRWQTQARRTHTFAA